VEVRDVRLDNDHLIISMSADAGVSFSLMPGALLKLRWETEAEWQPFIYMSRLELGSGFPFFFMVFLKE
jgi:hypothetical protein